MSFNKYFIPNPSELADQIKLDGSAAVVNRKIDSIIGNATSIKIFNLAYRLMHQGVSDNEILTALSNKFPKNFT